METWLIVVAAAVGGISGSLGALVTTRSSRLLSREERLDARRKDVYVEIVIALHRALGTASRCTFGGDTMLPDTDTLLRAYSMSLFGSSDVRRLCAEAFESYVQWLGKVDGHDERVTRFRTFASGVYALEDRVAVEMSAPPR